LTVPQGGPDTPTPGIDFGDHSAMRRSIVLSMVIVLAAAACSSSNPTAQVSTEGTSPTATPSPAARQTSPLTPLATRSPASAPANADAAGTVWLCRPGLADNPCAGDLSTTVLDAEGNATPLPTEPAADPPIDCFYVYPTVSQQSTVNADLSIDEEEMSVARYQVELFSQVCNVYAPIYPQLTVNGGGGATTANVQIAYQGVRAAFADYMANYNHGRGIVFIGHSQGAEVLTGLLHYEVDAKPEILKQLVSAFLIGGNVTVPAGKTVGGDFTNIPACASTSQTACVVAYSSFDTTPPAGAVFGRPSRLSMFSFGTGQQEVLCVNPAQPGGGAAPLETYFETAYVVRLGVAPKPTPATHWLRYPGAMTGECKNVNGASWLQITRTDPAGPMAVLVQSMGSTWGLHIHDMSLALGSMVDLVRTQTAAYAG
jgi:hypothetical protein